jgi:hypothetical protein
MAQSDTNKWLLAGIPLALLAVAGGVWFFLYANKAELHQSIPSNSDGILSISNADNANLVILTAKIENVIVDIQGPADEVDKARFYSDSPPNSKFDLPDNWGGLSGTITVPKGTLVELKPSKNTPVTIKDQQGERAGASGKTLLIDTTNLTQIRTGKSGIGIEGEGLVKVEDEGLHGAADDSGGSGTGQGPTNCGFGAQMLRDRCCARQNTDTPKTDCPGEWTYDNARRSCEYQCAPHDPFAGNPGGQNGGGGGSDGGDSSGITPLPGAAPQDPISQQCMNYPTADRSQCCDERLRNPLRIGPRPGFPDCTGRWVFDPRILNCKFQCASYGETLNIMDELKPDENPE